MQFFIIFLFFRNDKLKELLQKVEKLQIAVKI